MIELDDVGKEVILSDLRGQPKVKVIMAIKAPRGVCSLFVSVSGRHQAVESQCRAIRAFMKEHIND